MNLEVEGTKKILLVEESQGLTLNTDSSQAAVAIGGVPVKGPQGERGDTGLTGPTGVVTINIMQDGELLTSDPATIYYLPIDQKIVFNTSVPENNDSFIVLGNDSRLADARNPKPNSVTNSAIANGSINPNKITGTAVIDSDARLSNYRIPVDGSVTDVKIASGGLSASKITGTAIIEGDSRLTNTRTPTPGTVVDQSITSGGLSPSKITGTAIIEGDARLTNNRTPIDNSVTLSKIDSTTVKLNTIAAPSGNVNLNGNGLIANFVSGLTSPPADNDHAASKLYVDQKAVGLNVKDSVRLATTTNITLSGSQNIDGFSVVGDGTGSPTSNSNRILVKNQTAPEENGIYYANTSGSWNRTPDMNSSWSQVRGAYTFVTSGNTQANTAWVSNVTALTGQIGNRSSPIGFSLFSSVNILEGNGINITGQTIAAKIDDSSIKFNGDKKLYVNLVPVANGGTGATTASGARMNLELENVNNTSDADKPISTAQQSALDLKSNTTHTHGVTGDVTGTLGNGSTALTLKNTGSQTPNTFYTKFKADAQGRITEGSTLSESDIPSLGAAKITSGQFDIGRIPTGTGSSQVALGNHTHTFRTAQSFAIQGNIVTGSDLSVPVFFATTGFIPLTGQTSRTQLVKVMYKIGGGTGTPPSATFDIRSASFATITSPSTWTGITGFTSLVAVSTESRVVTPTAVTITDADQIALWVSGINGTPQNLSVTLVFAHTLNF